MSMSVRSTPTPALPGRARLHADVIDGDARRARGAEGAAAIGGNADARGGSRRSGTYGEAPGGEPAEGRAPATHAATVTAARQVSGVAPARTRSTDRGATGSGGFRPSDGNPGADVDGGADAGGPARTGRAAAGPRAIGGAAVPAVPGTGMVLVARRRRA
ncbi:hypothetical protein ACFWBC_23055 [Streptomyces sp. NPDC059985]|uniref:hypothetical protein n=1 Tax=Streptomyces sp. NPDC059985 TaxID=3347025 RepID=UPI0036BAF708